MENYRKSCIYNYSYMEDDEDIKNYPYEYLIHRNVDCIEDAIYDISSRAKQYLLDNDCSERRRHIENNYIHIYLRKGAYNGKKSLQIASFGISDEEYQRKGFGTGLINFLHRVDAGFEYTYIENIFNPHLVRWCIKNGWIEDEISYENPKCFYKKRFNFK